MVKKQKEQGPQLEGRSSMNADALKAVKEDCTCHKQWGAGEGDEVRGQRFRGVMLHSLEPMSQAHLQTHP